MFEFSGTGVQPPPSPPYHGHQMSQGGGCSQDGIGSVPSFSHLLVTWDTQSQVVSVYFSRLTVCLGEIALFYVLVEDSMLSLSLLEH